MIPFRVNSERILNEFCELVQIDSLSFSERAMADCLRRKLEKIGFSVSEDQTGEYYGSDAGNLYGYLQGDLSGAPILLSAHMDTVKPGIGKRAVLCEDGRITSDGTTILGADDVCGVVEILEGIRVLRENGIPHRSIEVLFPVGEELFIKGTNLFDFSKIQARDAYVLDLSGKIGSAALRAPSLITFEVSVKGRAAHAGFNPEDGIHAIQIMSRGIAGLKLGRVDEDTTLNIGSIQGGELVNIVPEICRCRGEIRSYSHEKALKILSQVQEQLRQSAEEESACAEVDFQVELTAYETGEDEAVVQRFVKACESLSVEPVLTETFGGSDNNNFALHGISGIVISCGMYQCHSTQEYTTVQDLEQGAALIAALLTDEN